MTLPSYLKKIYNNYRQRHTRKRPRTHSSFSLSSSSSSSESSSESSDSEDEPRRKRRCKSHHIAKLVKKAVAEYSNKQGSKGHAPSLPSGTDLVTIDQHLSTHLVDQIVAGHFVELAELNQKDIFKDSDIEYKLVVNLEGKQVYKPVKKSKDLDNFFKWLNNMLIFGTCYLKHRPNQGPEFLQYLYHILDGNKNYSWRAVAQYDREFRQYKQRFANFSWASINDTFHNKLNKVFNTHQPVPQPSHSNDQYSYSRNNNEQGKNYNNDSKFASNNGNRKIKDSCNRWQCSVCQGNCKYGHVCEFCGRDNHTGPNCRVKCG